MRVNEFKEQLVKAARMYTMCEKAGISKPMDVRIWRSSRRWFS
jgi:hypothetical protein